MQPDVSENLRFRLEISVYDAGYWNACKTRVKLKHYINENDNFTAPSGFNEYTNEEITFRMFKFLGFLGPKLKFLGPS